MQEVGILRLENYPELVRWYEQTCPGGLRSFTPRLIESPRGYWPTKVFAIAALSAQLQLQMQTQLLLPPSSSAPAVALVASTARAYGVPTYYIAPELAEAALRTDLAPELQLADLHWPFPALVLMLPRGCVRHPLEGDAPFIGLCRMPDPAIPETVEYQPAITCVTMMPEARQCPMYHTTQHVNGLSYAGSQCLFSDRSFPVVSDSADQQFSRTLLRLGLVLVSIMTARPELVESGRLLKRVKAKARDDPPRQWWSPTIVGRVFAPADPSVNGVATSHTAHRPHWVRGHVKSQAHGPQHSLRKIIWLQPYWTGR